ncbi:MAG: DUF6164 family protein [Pseudomonadota bacterium]
MAVMLFKLKNVPEDEADEVRALLQEHAIRFYETPPSRWGISMEAIWLEDEAQLAAARQLLDDYQKARTARIRTEYQRQRAAGEAPGLIDNIKRHPLQFIAIVLFILFILYVSTVPFLDLGK